MKPVINKMVKNFEVLIHPEKKGGFWVECPKLAGCFSQGKTVEDAAKNMKEAIELHTEELAKFKQRNLKRTNSKIALMV